MGYHCVKINPNFIVILFRNIVAYDEWNHLFTIKAKAFLNSYFISHTWRFYSLFYHPSTEYKIRKSLSRQWRRFWQIFDLISRDFKNQQVRKTKEKKTESWSWFFAHMGNSCSFSHIHMALSFDKFFPQKIVRASNLQR